GLDHRAADLPALANVDEMRRRVEAGAVARLLEDGCDRRRSRSLAVRSRDDDRGVRALGMAKRAEHRPHTAEPGANARCLERIEILERLSHSAAATSRGSSGGNGRASPSSPRDA